MNLQQRISLLCSAALIAGCASSPPQNEAGRIGSLDQSRTQVQTTSAEPIDEGEALQNYRRYLELAENSKEREEALRRVADLKVETEDGGETGDVDSIAYYQELLQRYPDSAANERVLYQLARAYEVNDQPAQALASFTELLQRYPLAEAGDEIRFRRAELLFQQRDYAGAELAYTELLQSSSGDRFHEKALYKQGWSRYKQSRYVAALQSFDQLLRRHPTLYDDEGIAPGAGSESRRVLLDDSLRTMALSLSLLGDADMALQQLQRLNSPPYDRALRIKLAALYQQKQRYTDAARIFEDGSQRSDSAQDALRAIAALEAGGFDTRVRQAKARYLQSWPNDDTRRSSQWSRQLARYHHAEAQRKKKPADYSSAQNWYDYYLQYHGEQADAAEIRFLLAELLFEQQQYEKAAIAYSEAATAGGGRAADAAYAAVLARRAQLQRSNSRNALLPGIIEQDLGFAEQHDTHPQAASVRLRAAEDLYALGRIDEAAAAAQPLATAAATGIQLGALQILAAQASANADYAAAEKVYGRIIPSLQPGARRNELEAALATALYRQGEAARDAGDQQAAIDKFLQLGRKIPNAPIRATADYDAASLLIATEQWDQAARVLEAFGSRFPNHELAGDAQRKLAIAYQNSGRKLEAARALSSVARGGGGDVAQAADWQAAELLREAGVSSQAIAAYAGYLDRYPQDFDRGMEARRHLADLEATSGKGPRYRQRLDAIIEADATAGDKRSDRSRTLAAQASMELAIEAVAAFENVRLKLPLESSLTAKKQRMDVALSALTRTASYGLAGTSTAATYRIAELYNQFGAELMTSPMPRGLDEEAREQYAVLLEERAFPFEEQAIEVHERNVARARQGDYDSWVERSYQALLKLAPAQYAKREQHSPVQDKW